MGPYAEVDAFVFFKVVFELLTFFLKKKSTWLIAGAILFVPAEALSSQQNVPQLDIWGASCVVFT